MGLYGVFYAATDGVLTALAAPLIPDELQTTGLALLQTGQALAYFVSSVLFGALAVRRGPAPPAWSRRRRGRPAAVLRPAAAAGPAGGRHEDQDRARRWWPRRCWSASLSLLGGHPAPAARSTSIRQFTCGTPGSAGARHRDRPSGPGPPDGRGRRARRMLRGYAAAGRAVCLRGTRRPELPAVRAGRSLRSRSASCRSRRARPGRGCRPTAGWWPGRCSSPATPTSASASPPAPASSTWGPSAGQSWRTSPSTAGSRRWTPTSGASASRPTTTPSTPPCPPVTTSTWSAATSRRRPCTVLADGVECPSLSPDGTRLVYKKRLPDLTWQLWVYDLATQRRTQLAEPANIDDQGAWLDDRTSGTEAREERPGQRLVGARRRDRHPHPARPRRRVAVGRAGVTISYLPASGCAAVTDCEDHQSHRARTFSTVRMLRTVALTPMIAENFSASLLVPRPLE